MTRAEAVALVTRERDVLSAIALVDYQHFETWRRQHANADAAAISNLTAAGAAIRNDWQGTVLKFDGIRCTCTGGLSGALSNWLARAKREAGR